MIANTSTLWQTNSLESDSIGHSPSERVIRKTRDQTHTKERNTSIIRIKAPWLEAHLTSTVELVPRRRSSLPVTSVNKMRTRLDQLIAASSQQLCAKYPQDVLRIAAVWAGRPCTGSHNPASTPITAVELISLVWWTKLNRPPTNILPPSRTANCPHYLR